MARDVPLLKLFTRGRGNSLESPTPETHRDEATGDEGPELAARPGPRLIQFLTELGAAMSSAGDATTFITHALERAGRS